MRVYLRTPRNGRVIDIVACEWVLTDTYVHARTTGGFENGLPLLAPIGTPVDTIGYYLEKREVAFTKGPDSRMIQQREFRQQTTNRQLLKELRKRYDECRADTLPLTFAARLSGMDDYRLSVVAARMRGPGGRFEGSKDPGHKRIERGLWLCVVEVNGRKLPDFWEPLHRWGKLPAKERTAAVWRQMVSKCAPACKNCPR